MTATDSSAAVRATKVLHLCETARGGVGVYVDTLTGLEREMTMQGVRERAVESRVVMPDDHESMVDGQTPKRLFRYGKRSPGALIRFVNTALSERFRFRPDIIFCHSSFSLLALLVLRPFSPGIKFIYCPHGWAGAREMKEGHKATLLRRAEGWLCGLAHRVVNVSRADQAFAESHGYRGQQMVIENAVRPALATAPAVTFAGPEDAIHLLFVGRLDRQKGLDILLSAWQQARQQNPRLRLHVIGEAVVSAGPGGERNVEGVDFLGWVDGSRIDGYYRAADLVLVPSRWEGLPLVLPEALRNGTPVLVSDRSKMPELIDEAVNGMSCRLDADAWARKLSSLKREALHRMRPACRDLFERRYHTERLGQEIANTYKDLTQ